MKKSSISLIAAALILGCGSEDDEAIGCDPIGVWTLQETTTSSDCIDVGDVSSTPIVIADAGDFYTVQMVVSEGESIECEGQISQSCTGTFSCDATFTFEDEDGNEQDVPVTADYNVTFSDDDAASGSSTITASVPDFTCTTRSSITGSR